MAQRETVEEILYRLHLNADEMNQQFVRVSRTLNENLARINRERNIIDLQTRVDLQGLDRATNATQIFQVRQRSLQRQLDLQRQRLNLLNVALRDTTERTGEDSDATQRAQIQYEQARLAVRRLETQLQRLNETQEETHSSATSWTDKINDFIKGGLVISAFENFRDVLGAVAEEVTRLNERFREMEKTAYDFNLPFDRAKDFAMQIRLAGGELEDVGGYLRGITQAYVTGEVDDPEWIALSKYGAEIVDANGRLKDYAAILDEVAKAYQRAKAEGNEIEFLQLTGGESGVTDAKQVLERLEEAKKDAARVVKSGLDPLEMQRSERAVNLLTIQFEEFHDALDNLITPAAIEFANDLFEVFRVGTQFIKDNKTELQDFGAALWNAFKNTTAGASFKIAGILIDKAKESAKGLKKEIGDLDKAAKGTDKNQLSQYAQIRINQFRDEIDDLRIELDFVDEYQRKMAQLNLWRERELEGKTFMSDDERLAIEDLYSVKLEKLQRERAEKENKILSDSKQRTAELMRETNALLLEGTLSPYQQETAEIRHWKEEALKALAEYRDAIGNKNQFVKEAAAITANALAKEAAAFEREMDRIKGKNQSLAEKIFEQEHSRRDIDIMRAQKERAEMYDEGVYSARMIERWYRNRKSEIARTARDDEKYLEAPDLPSSNYKVPDFYGRLQEQVKAEMSAVDHPAYQLQQQHEQLRQALDAPIQQFTNSVREFSELPERLGQGLEQATSALAQQAQQTQQREQQRKPPQITNNITVHVDLGGAYVFDNAMRTRLTDDITRDVADAVRDAVEKASNSFNFGYGN